MKGLVPIEEAVGCDARIGVEVGGNFIGRGRRVV
jgi:hypothetical protein